MKQGRSVERYPKLLAFLQLVYPSMYEQLAQVSTRSNIVEARLLCANSFSSYQVNVFSEINPTSGEIFKIIAKDNFSAPYSWDWRWVFALYVMYENQVILPVRFQQKVIALPTGRHPLSMVFFNNLNSEFAHTIQGLVSTSHESKKAITDVYESYLYPER